MLNSKNKNMSISSLPTNPRLSDNPISCVMLIYICSEIMLPGPQLPLLLKWILLLSYIFLSQAMQYAFFFLFPNICWNSDSYYYLHFDLVLSFWQLILQSQTFLFLSFGFINSFVKTVRSLFLHKVYLQAIS